MRERWLSRKSGDQDTAVAEVTPEAAARAGVGVEEGHTTSRRSVTTCDIHTINAYTDDIKRHLTTLRVSLLSLAQSDHIIEISRTGNKDGWAFMHEICDDAVG